MVGGAMGLAAAGALYGISAAMNTLAVGAAFPWDVVEVVAGICVMFAPGIYLGGIAALMVGQWAGWILSVVFNVLIFSATWVLLRRGGPRAGVRRVFVVMPWLLYFALLVAGSRIS